MEKHNKVNTKNGEFLNIKKKPFYEEENQSYEIDELRTYCGNKKNECWTIYAINKATDKIIDFVVVGVQNLLINSILKLNPKRIYTDKLNIFPIGMEVALQIAYY